jgi:hypothetical protein
MRSIVLSGLVLVLGVGCGGGAGCPAGSILIDGRCIATDVDADGGALPGSDGGVEPVDGAVTSDGEAVDLDGCTPTPWYADDDRDGFGAGEPVLACSAPTGHVTDDADCDDDAASVHPAALELCDAIDNDCDGAIDDGLVDMPQFADADRDGYGAGAIVHACRMLEGHVGMHGDCDDAAPLTHPGATESCNMRDDNCNGSVDEGVLNTFYRDANGDGHGNLAMPINACVAPTGYVARSTDCNDTCATCFPGNAELCDRLDNDCDGLADDGLAVSRYYADCDRDGYAATGAQSVEFCAVPTYTPTACGGGGWTSRAPTATGTTDCADREARAFPGQSMYFTTQVEGVADFARRFDFNCDGSSTLRSIDVGSCSVPRPGMCSATPGWLDGSAPACGVSESWAACRSSICAADSVAQACR